VAPGTFGSIVGLLFGLAVAPFGFWFALTVTVVVTIAGIWICGESARKLGVHDHSAIVWDEVAGMMLTLLAAPATWWGIGLAFGLFRLFDVWKPWPIREVDHGMRGGLGIMLDDVMAAVMAAALLLVSSTRDETSPAQSETVVRSPPRWPRRSESVSTTSCTKYRAAGIVYLSHDPFYGRDVAIKLYHATGNEDAESRNARRMFMGEAHMIGKLHHPNIVPIYDAGEEDGRRYVVTEHIHGARTLSAYCRPGSLLPIDQVVSILYKCAKALHYAHSRGVVHRDIKPSNILLTQDGDVRIVDFGIALVADSDVSRLEGVAGSPAYMSPEQVQGHPLDARSDLYSLGAVMYEMLRQRLLRAGARQIAAPGGAVGSRIAAAYAPKSRRTRGSRQARAAEAPNNLPHGHEFAAELTRVHQKLRACRWRSTTKNALRSCASCASSTIFRTARSAK
jgi:phosphatidylglycerophosphatase A